MYGQVIYVTIMLSKKTKVNNYVRLQALAPERKIRVFVTVRQPKSVEKNHKYSRCRSTGSGAYSKPKQ